MDCGTRSAAWRAAPSDSNTSIARPVLPDRVQYPATKPGACFTWGTTLFRRPSVACSTSWTLTLTTTACIRFLLRSPGGHPVWLVPNIPRSTTSPRAHANRVSPTCPNSPTSSLKPTAHSASCNDPASPARLYPNRPGIADGAARLRSEADDQMHKHRYPDE